MRVHKKRKIHFTLTCFLAVFLASGCESRSTRIAVPEIPDDLAKSIISHFDSNRDGIISENELPQRSMFETFDEDSDKAITETEIAKVIDDWQLMKIGLTAFSLRFHRDGQPLVNATVTLEPYEFMGTEILPASGITNSDGFVVFSVAKEHIPIEGMNLMHCGFYRIRISKKANGKETIASAYNTNTKLGYAVLPSTRGGALIDLKQ